MVEAPKQSECVRNMWSKVGISQMKVYEGEMYQTNGTACAKTERKERILEFKASLAWLEKSMK